MQQTSTDLLWLQTGQHHRYPAHGMKGWAWHQLKIKQKLPQHAAYSDEHHGVQASAFRAHGIRLGSRQQLRQLPQEALRAVSCRGEGVDGRELT